LDGRTSSTSVHKLKMPNNLLLCVVAVTDALRHTTPVMRSKPTFENPLKVIATVVAQADIVGVEAPWRAPNTIALPAKTEPLRRIHGTWGPRREIDRSCLHPLLRLGGDSDAVEPWLTSLLALPPPVLALAVPFAAVLTPLLPVIVAARKASWAEEVAESAAEHQADFDANWLAYRAQQSITVERLLAAQAAGTRDPLLPPPDEPFTVSVTMATGQEGAAVVGALSAASDTFPNLVIRALVRNPESAKAKELSALPRVRIVQADSVDEESLAEGLVGADAAYLCTTLNQAGAGKWAMQWDGGKYEVDQGVAFAAAAARTPTLKQVVYGTAPARKWPEAFRVEPPIHYAAKWRIEEILTKAGVPLTSLRKCPYHENFTKLTKPKPRADGQGDGWWQPGNYLIKALTPAAFEYNMLGPGDIGAWAILALSHPTILSEASLSIAADCLTGKEMADGATRADAFGPEVAFEYKEQPRWLFEALSYVEPTFVYISGLQRWNSDGGRYDLTKEDVARLRALHAGMTWEEHLQRDGLTQFTATMAELLPDVVKGA